MYDTIIVAPTQADYFHSGRREFLMWERWRRGYSRCPYCTGASDEDWMAVCDCWMAERTLCSRCG